MKQRLIYLVLLCFFSLVTISWVVGCGQTSTNSDSSSTITTIPPAVTTTTSTTTTLTPGATTTTLAGAPTTTTSTTTTTSGIAATSLMPSDLTYLGAFRFPYVDLGDNITWAYGGTAATYYPNGDPANTDAYPGSIYAMGHNSTKYISEISIPLPVISEDKNPADLNEATTLRPFTNIRTGIGEIPELFATSVGNGENPPAGLAYLPAQGSQTQGKLYSCWGAHFQEDAQNRASHMWCNLDFSGTAGAWRIGTTFFDLYQSNDFMFEIPAVWANANASTTGLYLATGRFREGGHGGQGPNLYAIAPWLDGISGATPTNGTPLTAVKLLGYSSTHPENPTYGTHTMTNYSDADEWDGAEWLTTGSKAAVVFVGTKALGDTWYGYADGTKVPTDGSDWDGLAPDYPNNEKGWWATSFEAEAIFYDPTDLAAVANGTIEPYEPQPYATLSLDQYLYNIDKINDPAFPANQNRYRIGSVCFDRTNGYLYIIEARGEAIGAGGYDDNQIVHVFRIDPWFAGI